MHNNYKYKENLQKKIKNYHQSIDWVMSRVVYNKNFINFSAGPTVLLSDNTIA
jgi:hypothetical protein